MQVRLTRAVKGLLIACFAAFLAQQTSDLFFHTQLLAVFGLVPAYFVNGHWFWQLFTYSFMHGEVMHLFLNLMMLAFIGGEIEAVWGTPRFLRYYFFCSVSAGLIYLLLQTVFWKEEGLHSPMVGASGAIYGLLMAYGLMFGERMLLFMMIFPMKAKHFVWILAAVEFMTSAFSGRGGMASLAHLGGMAAGFAYLWGAAAYSVYRKRRAGLEALAPFRKGPKSKKKRLSQHLKLVIDNERSKGKDPDGDGDGDEDQPKTWH